MDFSSLATDEWIEELKCTVCGNYLSYFPIRTSLEGQNVCGRCPLPLGSYVRNEIYEVASKNTIFPCRYKSEGCCEILMPKDIPHHEEGCEYTTVKCITQVFTKCNVKVSRLNMTKHCHEQHSKYFLNDGEFEIDVTKSQKYYYLLEHKNQVLTLKCSLTDKLFRFALSHSSYHKLKFSCGSRTMSIKREASGDNNINGISLESLISPQESKISAKIYLEAKIGDKKTSTENLNQGSSNLGRCSWCSYLPSGNMRSGASCPHCGNPFHSRNTLMYDTDEFLFGNPSAALNPVKVGTTGVGHLLETETHQKLCPLQTFSSCRWNGQVKNLESHFLQDHRPLFVNSSSITQNMTSINNYHNYRSTPQCYLLKYSQYFFNLCRIQDNQKCYWIMQMLGEFKDIFSFDIAISADSNKLPQFILSQSCCKQSTRQELLYNLHNHCYVSLDQIRNCLKVQNNVHFKIRILKK